MQAWYVTSFFLNHNTIINYNNRWNNVQHGNKQFSGKLVEFYILRIFSIIQQSNFIYFLENDTNGLLLALQIGRFDLERDDPLILSNTIGQAVVSCWSMNENGRTMSPSLDYLLFQYNKFKKYCFIWKTDSNLEEKNPIRNIVILRTTAILRIHNHFLQFSCQIS